MTRVEQLRNVYPQFIYHSATHQLTAEGLQLEFVYWLGKQLQFKHIVVLEGIEKSHLSALPDSEIKTLVEHIGMIEAFSYWKATCAPHFQVAAVSLTPGQLQWWHTLLIKGMGEFFYVNQIDFTPTTFVQIESNKKSSEQSHQPRLVIPECNAHTKILIPIGGGKDSIVTLELLTSSYPKSVLGCLLVNPTKAAWDTARISGITDLHIVRRQFDPHLSEFTRTQGLNGHVPISASFAWISLLVARLNNYQLIAVSNEASSNEGSVEFHGRIINHQYSKTYEFEAALQQYTRQWLAPQTPWYFSILRPLQELQIAEIFAQHTQYHQAFRSCNRGQKTNSWCGNCPKCLFAYLILSPFLPQDRPTELFGSNVLDNDLLWPDLQKLLGLVPQKPLECVGTRAESLAALNMTIARLSAENKPLPRLLIRAQKERISSQTDLDPKAQAIRHSWNAENSVPTTLANLLKTQLHSVQHTQ